MKKGVEMSNLVKHAERELKLAGLFDKDSDYGGMLAESVLELIKVFSDQGHSGHSAGMTSNLFNELSRYKNLTPITLKDDEWIEVAEDRFQNNRISSVFKDGKEEKPYFIDAYYKKTQNGETWSGTLELQDGTRIKRCYIKDVRSMPTIYIDVIQTGSEMVIKDMKQLDELKKYYDLEIVKINPSD